MREQTTESTENTEKEERRKKNGEGRTGKEEGGGLRIVESPGG